MEEEVNKAISFLRGKNEHQTYKWLEHDFYDWKSWKTIGKITTVVYTSKIAYGYLYDLHKVDGPAIVHFCGDNEWFYYGLDVTKIMNDFCKESDIDPRNSNEIDKELIKLKISSLERQL